MGMHAYPPSDNNVSGHNGAVKGKYGRYSWRNRRKKEDIWMGKQNNVKKIWRKKDGSTSNVSQTKSYLEALKANSWRKPNQPIHLKELGNEWLTRSAVAKLSPVRSMVLVQDQLRSLGYADIQGNKCLKDVPPRSVWHKSLVIFLGIEEAEVANLAQGLGILLDVAVLAGLNITLVIISYAKEGDGLTTDEKRDYVDKNHIIFA
ncbi:hypothetical protein Vadar_004348 [Vaccinium darrowii]|uniref:Uncharacterized protein n=1 Tax=Vaccinium darrowii TaxID=229202 RepID=A0ACB7XXB6_9ERIC|nr:hypothetical protein Vadar_004348 [Vaccinium darrowii]